MVYFHGNGKKNYPLSFSQLKLLKVSVRKVYQRSQVQNVWILHMFSKLGPILSDTYLYFIAVTYLITKDQKVYNLETDSYGCESEEKIFP